MKFKERKIGKFLTSPLIKKLIGSIPGLDIVFNFLNLVNGHKEGEIASEPFKINKETLIQDLIKLAITGYFIYLWLYGHITFEEAEQAKEFLGG